MVYYQKKTLHTGSCLRLAHTYHRATVNVISLKGAMRALCGSM